MVSGSLVMEGKILDLTTLDDALPGVIHSQARSSLPAASDR